MGYGYLNPKQREALAQHVRGRHMTDYGCGDMALACDMLAMGAEHVLCIDKTQVHRKPPHVGITFRHGYFHEIDGTYPHLFLSWPVNYLQVEIVKAAVTAETVVYLGKNTDGSACGTPDLFEVLVRREILAYVPDRINTLIIYGSFIAEPNEAHREPMPEEQAGLTSHVGEILAYESIEHGC